MKLPTQSKASNIVSNKKRKQGNDVSGLGNALSALAKDTLCRNRLNDIGKNNVVNDIVILAEQFKRMSDALGSKIKAGNACKDFEQFLNREEKRQLQQYKRANEKNLIFQLQYFKSQIPMDYCWYLGFIFSAFKTPWSTECVFVLHRLQRL